MIAAEKGESVFFKSVATGGSTTFQWKATHPRKYGQHTLDLMGREEKKKKKIPSWADGGSR